MRAGANFLSTYKYGSYELKYVALFGEAGGSTLVNRRLSKIACYLLVFIYLCIPSMPRGRYRGEWVSTSGFEGLVAIAWSRGWYLWHPGGHSSSQLLQG